MKRLFFTMLVFISVGLLALPLPAGADMIDIKNKGVITGTILKEDDSSVTFLDSWGKKTVYPRSQVLFLEKQKSVKAAPPPVKIAKPALKPASTGSAAMLKLPSMQDNGKNDFGLEAAVAVASIMQKVSDTYADFITGNAENTKANLSVMAQRVQDLQKDYSTSNYVLGFIAMGMMAAGILGGFALGLGFIYKVFSESFLWGAVVIGYIISSIAVGMLGPQARIFSGTLALGVAWFVLTNWKVVRVVVVCQLFTANLFLLGYLLLKMVS